MQESGSLCCLSAQDCKLIICCDVVSVFSYSDGSSYLIYPKAKAISSFQPTLTWLELHKGGLWPKTLGCPGHAAVRVEQTYHVFDGGGGFPERSGKSKQGTFMFVPNEVRQ